jgi:hypothetical protein
MPQKGKKMNDLEKKGGCFDRRKWQSEGSANLRAQGLVNIALGHCTVDVEAGG